MDQWQGKGRGTLHLSDAVLTVSGLLTLSVTP